MMEQRIKQDKKKSCVLINLKKQQMLFDIIHLLHDGVIRMGDLQVFSDELRDNVKFLQERAKVTGTYNIR